MPTKAACPRSLFTFVLLCLMGLCARAAALDERVIVRIAVDRVPADLADYVDPCAIDRDEDGHHAVLYLTPQQLAELDVPHESLGLVRDYLAARVPMRTLARHRIPSFERVLGEAMPPRPTLEDVPEPLGPGGEPVLSFDHYHTLAEGVDYLFALADAYPHITRLESIGQTIEGRDIWALVVTDQPLIDEPDEEGILFTGVTHAREWATHETMLYLAQQLTTRYHSDPQIKHVVDHAAIWLVPVVNPDGYEYSWTNDRLWRKNRRDVGFCDGVDINRNYPYEWGGPGASGDPCSPIYRGAFPASEPETEAMINLLEEQQFAVAVSYHTYGQLVLYPWGHTVHVAAQSYTSLRAIGKKYAKLVEQVHGKEYVQGPGAYTIYVVNGDFGDHAYGAHGALAFTPELRPATQGQGGFLLPEPQILPNNEENWPIALWLMQNVADAREVTRADGGTLIASPAVGDQLFSLPLTPAHQKPGVSLGLEEQLVPNIMAWLDDAAHVPPEWGRMGVDFEAAGAGGGYLVEMGESMLGWAAGLTGYTALPDIFEDGAQVQLSNVQPGLNLVGVPGSPRPVYLRNVGLVQRKLVPRTATGGTELTLATRTALQDADGVDPWIDWNWVYTDVDGVQHVSHPAGDDGASPVVLPFRAYEVNLHVPSSEFGSTQNPVYLLSFPGGQSDCNGNGVLDADELAAGALTDCNANALPDVCESLGDADVDGDVDVLDFGAFQSCHSGPGQAALDDCATADLDADGDVDLIDYACFMRLFTSECAIDVVAPPLGEALCPGSDVSLAVETSDTVQSYRWYFRGQPVPGATDSALFIEDIRELDQGKYRVEMRSACETRFSAAADVQVLDAPFIASQPIDTSGCDGDIAQFTIAAEGVPPLSYQWRYDGQPIAGATSTSYTVASVNEEAVGMYDCAVTGGCGSQTISQAAFLDSDTPKVITQPLGADLCVGDSYFLFVETSQLPQHQWYKDGQPIAGATDFFLGLIDVTPEDVGDYHALLSNDCGTTLSDIATVTVMPCAP